MHHRDTEFDARVIEQVARRKVVGAVDDDVVTRDDVDDVARRESRVVGDHVDVGVEHRQGLLRGVDLSFADAVDVVQDLALQVALVDFVHVDNAEGSNSSRREVERRR